MKGRKAAGGKVRRCSQADKEKETRRDKEQTGIAEEVTAWTSEQASVEILVGWTNFGLGWVTTDGRVRTGDSDVTAT